MDVLMVGQTRCPAPSYIELMDKITKIMIIIRVSEVESGRSDRDIDSEMCRGVMS